MVAPTELILSERITRFGRLLRAAGLRIGPGQILEGLEALAVVDVTNRHDFFWTLHAAWVKRREEREVFSEAFRLFWRQPDRPVNRVLEELLASSRLAPGRVPRHARRRVLDALAEERAAERAVTEDDIESVRLAYSDVERLREKDFDQMSSAELREAREMIERFRFPVRDLTTRRWRSVSRSADLDVRRSLRQGLRQGRDLVSFSWRRRATRPPTLVALCDVSGSMAGYTRMLLRFLHALANDRERVHTFLFGTRLSNVTRALRMRDADAALAELGQRVLDWDGGTRIGACIGEFNRRWSRRVLAQGAVVLLITDGLDRGDPGLIEGEMARLQRSARRVVWLNPLLRYADFRPEARGVRTMLPYVDDFRPAHNVASLESLARALAEPRERDRLVGYRASYARSAAAEEPR